MQEKASPKREAVGALIEKAAMQKQRLKDVYTGH
jgi:hypothetical protein